tara:strand:+ start:160 stop:483 length:324 start_codon:yes stop_codon:yes gene_type:complete
MSIFEKKEKNLNELIEKLNTLTSTYSHSSYDSQKIKTEKNELLRQKSEIEKKNRELMREHKYLKKKIVNLQEEINKRSNIEDKFNQDIEDLSRETENLVNEIDEWQT